MKKFFILSALISLFLLVSYLLFYKSDNMDSLDLEEINSQEQFVYSDIKYSNEMKKTDEEDLLLNQQNKIKKMKSEYNKSNHTVDNPYIIVNPYLNNNLSAYIIFNSKDTISWKYEVISKEGSLQPNFTYSSKEKRNGTIIIPVVSLYENYENNVKLTIKSGFKEKIYDLKIKTTKSPNNYKNGNETTPNDIISQGIDIDSKKVTNGDMNSSDFSQLIVNIYDDEVLKYFNNGYILTSSYDIYDIDGELRFSWGINTISESIKLNNGLFLTKYEENYYLADLMGKIYSQYKVPVSQLEGVDYEFHHDSVITPDGYIYALGGFTVESLSHIPLNTPGYFTSEALVFKFDINGGYPQKVYDISEYFKDSKTNNGKPLDIVHLNSIDYYKERDELILSAKNQSTIIGLNRKTGNLNWIVKNEDGVVTDYEKNALLEIENKENFKYTSGNHSVFVMRTKKYNTTKNKLYLSIFNNNNCMEEENEPSFSDEFNSTCNFKDYSSMYIYSIDFKTMKVSFEEEIIPNENRWSMVRSSVFTDIEGIYQVHFADLNDRETLDSLSYSDLYILDEDGLLLAKIQYLGLGNIYRSRIIQEYEIYDSLDSNIKSLFNE